MKNNKNFIFLAIALITIGSGWLLSSVEVMPGVDWIWTLGLIVTGIVILLLGGIDKATIVAGPFFIATGILSVLRQNDYMQINTEVPILIIVLGILILFSCLSSLPDPPWLLPLEDNSTAKNDQ
jgi:hypothetical protein